MALLNWTITAHMLFIILISLRTRSDGVLIVKPQDTYALAGQLATLNCSTSSTEGVHWYYGTSYTYVYAGRKLISPFNNRLKVEVYQNEGTTAFNLVFPTTKPEDAGTYICGDIQGRGQTISAEMTIFTADGNGSCRSNIKPDGVVIPNDCNIDPDTVQLSCNVTFYGNNPPQLQWKKVPEDGNSVANTECQAINNRVTCHTSITGNRTMNGSSYVCQTTGPPEPNIRLCSISVKHLIYAFNMKTTTHPTVGQEVQCNSETSQSCYYKWKHSDIVVSTSRAIIPRTTGHYQCEAECNIRGKRCIVFGYVYISDEGSTSCSTGCVVGICVIIFILILVILISIHRFLIKKGRRTRMQSQTESETQYEQTDLMQPRKEFETDKTKLVQTLVPIAAYKQQKAVFGLAILGDELFASSHEYPRIEVFGDLQNLKSAREFVLRSHQLEIPWDMQSSCKQNCLYIVNVKRDEKQTTEVIKIDREGVVQNKWITDCTAGRLSVTYESNVIVTSLYTPKIEEYSPDGVLIHSIELPPDAGILNPWVTLKRNENEYIISHGNRGDSKHRVCLINQKGSVQQFFGGKKGSSNGQLFVPIQMAAYSDGHILVADKDNSRVVLLSPELKFLKSLFLQGDYLRFPNRLCLDEQNKRLFVCDNQWLSNMKPWTNGKILVFDVSSVQASLNTAVKKK